MMPTLAWPPIPGVPTRHQYIQDDLMIIRQGNVADYPQLLDIWLRAVRATLHGQSIGRALLDFGRQSRHSMSVDVNEQYPQAVGFYQHYGFIQTGRPPWMAKAGHFRCCA